MPEAIIYERFAIPTFENIFVELSQIDRFNPVAVEKFSADALVWLNAVPGDIIEEILFKFLNNSSGSQQSQFPAIVDRLKELHNLLKEKRLVFSSQFTANAAESTTGKLLTVLSTTWDKFANTKVIENIKKITQNLAASEKDIVNPKNKATIQEALSKLNYRCEQFQSSIKDSNKNQTSTQLAELRHETLNDAKKIVSHAYSKIEDNKSLKAVITHCIDFISGHVLNSPKPIWGIMSTSMKAVRNANEAISSVEKAINNSPKNH